MLRENRNPAADCRLFFNEDCLLVLRRRGDDLPRGVDQRWCSIPSSELGDCGGRKDSGDAANGGDERRQVLADRGEQRIRARFDERRRQDRLILFGHVRII